jgi:outer membrane protein OmpA-like peptidoglycan-associated protein
MNQQNPLLLTYLIQNTIWWLEYAQLDGLRVDTYPYNDKEAIARWTKAILKEYPSSKFSIEGHTDSDGSNEFNLRLSDSRALAVKKYLVEQGIDEFRLSAMGYGESKPIDTNNTKAGKANNRRVEVKLVK